MNMKEQRLHRKETIRISGFLWFSLKITLFILVLFFIIGPRIAQAQEESPPEATAVHQDSSESPSGKATKPPCKLSPIVVTTLPDKIPGYTQLDPETKLHVTGTAQVIDLESYRLEITGKVAHPLKLKYDDLRCMPKIEARPTLVCPGFFEDIATWAGASLKYVLELADVQEGASRIRLVSADGYTATVSMGLALSKKNFLAYEWERKPIPILHGFPVRAVFPDLNGNEWVKWLIRIEVE
jgi:DMSO/TMAO reductase YedYZ molybdopterin-dependent catalytic subunit